MSGPGGDVSGRGSLIGTGGGSVGGVSGMWSGSIGSSGSSGSGLFGSGLRVSVMLTPCDTQGGFQNYH